MFWEVLPEHQKTQKEHWVGKDFRVFGWPGTMWGGMLKFFSGIRVLFVDMSLDYFFFDFECIWGSPASLPYSAVLLDEASDFTARRTC